MIANFSRMTDKTRTPTEGEILSFIGEKTREAWTNLNRFIQTNYSLEPEIIFYGAKYGWALRYRKSGKTICTLFPENNAFTTLIVLGKEEAQKAQTPQTELSTKIYNLINQTEQLHDGRWLWIRAQTTTDIEDITRLLKIKRKPKPTSSKFASIP
jgi:hypothetical protein